MPWPRNRPPTFASLAAFGHTPLPPTRSAAGPLRHGAFLEQERGESGAGDGGARLCGTSGPPTQSPPCPSSAPLTKAPFSRGPELISCRLFSPPASPPDFPSTSSGMPALSPGSVALMHPRSPGSHRGLCLLGYPSCSQYSSNWSRSLGTVPGRQGQGLRGSLHVGVGETGVIFLIPLAYSEFSPSLPYNEMDSGNN